MPKRFPSARALDAVLKLGLTLSLTAAVAGCGADASGADDFVGTWRYLDVSSMLQCTGADPQAQPPEPNKTFARGVSSALVDLSPSPLLSGVFCDFGFDVSGPKATAQPGQTCALTALDSLTINQPDMQAPKWTFTLNSPTTAEELIDATAHFSISGAASTCSWSLTGHLQRVSKD